jgi:4-oxalocrotonate tautomerase
MPIVQVKVLENVFTREQKQEMLTKVTEAMVDVEGEALRPFTWVLIEEVKSGDLGIGGKVMSTQDVKDVQAG